MENDRRFFAFISYNHKDVRWAKWLRRNLEWYRLPSYVQNEIDARSRYIRPVFRDRDELDAGNLNATLQTNLSTSRFLVVICSNNSAQSKWVNDEIQTFLDAGRCEDIILFIVDDNAFPPAILQWNEQHPDACLLGIAVHDDGRRDKHKAFIRVVSRMLGVSFDSLWKRHQREMRLKIALGITALMLLSGLLYWYALPVRLSASLTDEPTQLPSFRSAILYIGDNEYQITSADTTLQLASLPGGTRLTTLPVRFVADRYYEPVESDVQIAAGLTQTLTIQLRRDDTFAHFSGHIYDEEMLPLYAAHISVSDGTQRWEAQSDNDGHFDIQIQTEQQTSFKAIHIEHDGYESYERDTEVPGTTLKFILFRSNK